MSSLSLFAIGLGPMELCVVAVVALLLFGNRLPGAMRGLGQGFREFRDGLRGVEKDLQVEEVSR
jgi:sec-independent protein translocase protein TatA